MDGIPLLAAAAFVTAAVSCSIKADRTDCPCRLKVDDDDCGSVLTLWRKGVPAATFRLDTCAFDCDTPVVEVEKSNYIISVSRGDSEICVGSQSDSLYAWGSIVEVDCTGDCQQIFPDKGKQFVTLSIYLTGTSGPSPCDSKFSVIVSGGTGAFDLMKMEPKSGMFEYRDSCYLPGFFTVRMLRQNGSAPPLELSIVRNGMELAVIQLSERIVSSGYDWNAKDLEDIYMEIEIVEGEVVSYVVGWKNGFDREEIL